MIQWNDTHDKQVRALNDRALLAAYQRTDGEPGNPEADALAEEIERVCSRLICSTLST